jgi:peptidoglycan/LPS O-acetylase OafA/YrhL
VDAQIPQEAHLQGEAPVQVEERNLGLDGLRGIAALSVALGHCLLHVTGLPLWDTSLRDFPSMPWSDIGIRVVSSLLPSDAAVMVFFVLSGHVLWGSFQRKRLRFFADLPDYASARIYRLFPVAIASALPLGLLKPVSAAELVRNMLLLSNSVNGVLWSLQVEVVASFALFAVWGLTRGVAWKLLLALALALVAARFAHGQFPVLFFPAFILGALISSVPQRVWRNHWLLAGATTALVFASLFLGHNGTSRLLQMAAATVLVGCVASGSLRFLRGRIPVFLGAVSYPFYLTHLVGLTLAEPMLAALSPMPRLAITAAYAVASIAVTLPLAWLLHVLVENPCLRARPRIGPTARRMVGSAGAGISGPDRDPG